MRDIGIRGWVSQVFLNNCGSSRAESHQVIMLKNELLKLQFKTIVHYSTSNLDCFVTFSSMFAAQVLDDSEENSTCCAGPQSAAL